ncbi:MAG: hypothetical protein AAF291_13525 [Pseudomonadota bacterium]
MPRDTPVPPPQTLHLAPGARAVINGAVVSAREACTLEVGPGAYVLTGRALWPSPDAPRNPRDELYFSLLDCGGDEERFFAERFRLFSLLSEVVTQDAAFEHQRECAHCAAALLGGDPKRAVQCAAHLASNGIDTGRTRTKVAAASSELDETDGPHAGGKRLERRRRANAD